MLRILTAIAAVVLLCVVGAATASAASARSCKKMEIMQGGAVFAGAYHITASGVACTKARRIARQYISLSEGAAPPPHPFGFTCRPTAGYTGSVCRNGSKIVRWSRKP